MGWSSGTRVFDAVVGLLLSDKLIEEKIEEIILELEVWVGIMCMRVTGMTTHLFMVLFVNCIQIGL